MSEWQPSRGKGKAYSAKEFRSYPKHFKHTGEVKRHEFDCELAAAAASYAPGPRYSPETMAQIRSVLAQADNFSYYGASSANSRDRAAANAVLRSAYYDEPVTLTPHQAAHIRNGAQFIADHKDELPPGFVRSAARLYANVFDESGHKVVDGRMFRTSK